MGAPFLTPAGQTPPPAHAPAYRLAPDTPAEIAADLDALIAGAKIELGSDLLRGAAKSETVSDLTAEPDTIAQTALSIGMGPPWADLADAVDLASLAAARRRHAYRMAADAVDHLIALMDVLEADTEDREPDQDGGEADDACDLEDDGTAEPSLGAPENHPGRYHKDIEGREHFSRGRCQLGSQVEWATGGTEDREDGYCDLEPEAGYDLPEGDDERCGSGEVDTEWSCGWTAKVNQVHLGDAQDEQEYAALERHGCGFVRSGHEDAEDDELGEEHAPERAVWVFGPRWAEGAHA